MGTRTRAAAGLMALSLTLAACGSDDSSGDDGPTPVASGSVAAGTESSVAKVGVILPDSTSSARWETADRKYLSQAFEAAGVEYDIQNAEGDGATFRAIADQMITNGANVLMIASLDPETGRAVLDEATSQGLATIDYDRLTLGGNAQYYVSFDNVAVGRLQGEGLASCLEDSGVERGTVVYLNGSPTDNNATMFREGYDGVLSGLPQYTKVDEQSVPSWSSTEATALFEQMLASQPDISGVLAANDTLGNAAISVLKKKGRNGKVPVTGQDATVQGLQNILAGDQCMTVYKAIKREADAAAGLAISLARGDVREAPDITRDTTSNREVPSLLLEPLAITRATVKTVVDDGYVTAAELCTPAFVAACREAGISP